MIIERRFNIAALPWWVNNMYIMNPPRLMLMAEFRARRALEQKNKCCYCEVTMTSHNSKLKTHCTAEHVIPQSLGGTDDFHNIVAACLECNGLRGNLEIPVFMEKRRMLLAA